LQFGIKFLNFGTKVGPKAPYRFMPQLRSKTPWGEDIEGQNLNFGPLLPETVEHWPTFSTFLESP